MSIQKMIAEFEDFNQPFALATIVQTEGSVPGKVGFKLLIDSSKKLYGTVGGGGLEKRIVSDCISRMESGKSGLQEYILTETDALSSGQNPENIIPMMCNGKVWVYFEIHQALNTIYVFGGGHVGRSVLYQLNRLPFRLVLIDNRAEYADPIKNPYAHQCIYMDYIQYVKKFQPSENSFIIIMTHEHTYDIDILMNIYKKEEKVKYIGVIASRTKAKSTIEKLREKMGKQIDLSFLYMPIGLDIGGSTDSEIAISIAAEIQAVLYNKPAKHLSIVSGIK